MSLRIIAGTYKGKKIESSTLTGVRPTKSKVREAVMSVLGSYGVLNGSKVLDLFCGTGAMAFEAISRGAESAFLFDSSYANLSLVGKTSTLFGLEDKVCYLCTDPKFAPQTNEPRNIIFIDPPYSFEISDIFSLLQSIDAKGWIEKGAIVVLETAKSRIPDIEDISIPDGYSLLKERKYGITKIIFLQKIF